MIGNGYNGNGRPVITIYQHGGPWTGAVYILHTPNGVHKNLTPEAVKDVLVSYLVRPVIECQVGVCGNAKTFFRSAISGMPLPEMLQS